MSTLFAIFKEYLLWSLMLWVLLFVAFTALFARGNLTALAKGLTRLLLSIVISPFVFLRRATHAVIGFDASQEECYRASEQYILNKAMMILQAGMIILAIGTLAAGGVATWNVLVPPRDVRAAARDHRPMLEKQRADAASAVAAVSKLDAEWASQQTAVIATYRADRQAAIGKVTKQMSEIANSLATYGNDNVKTIVASVQQRAASQSAESLRDLAYAKSGLDGVISSNWYWLDDWSRGLISQWNDLWLAKRTGEFQLRNISVADIRNTAQPNYSAAVATSTDSANRLQESTEAQAQLDEAASLKWKSAAWRAAAILVTFLLFIWTAALLIESMWLAVRVAGDVRRLRQVADQTYRETATDDRLAVPIRENLNARSVGVGSLP